MFRAFTLMTLLLLTPAIALLPVAHACHSGTWADGPQDRLEVLGVGSNAIGIYTRDRTWQEGPDSSGCEGMTWARACTGLGGQTTAPAVVVPEIRVLGEVIVPETPLLGPTPVPHTLPPGVTSLGTNCANLPVHVGVYTEGIVPAQAGTDTPLLP